MKYFLSYFLTLLSFLAVDFFWLMVLAKNLYAKYLYPVIGQNVNLPAAIVFYIFYVFGLFILIIQPNIEAGTPLKVILTVALFGAVAYATYDLTNLATIKDWPILIAIIDIIWGAVLTAITAIIGFYITKAIV